MVAEGLRDKVPYRLGTGLLTRSPFRPKVSSFYSEATEVGQAFYALLETFGRSGVAVGRPHHNFRGRVSTPEARET
jgi:hypothetical protein